MKIVISGSSGLVGTALRCALASRGDDVVQLIRPSSGLSHAPNSPAGGGVATWGPAREMIDPMALEGADALVHLGGESVASGRWTAARKRRIINSRVASTRLRPGPFLADLPSGLVPVQVLAVETDPSGSLRLRLALPAQVDGEGRAFFDRLRLRPGEEFRIGGVDLAVDGRVLDVKMPDHAAP